MIRRPETCVLPHDLQRVSSLVAKRNVALKVSEQMASLRVGRYSATSEFLFRDIPIEFGFYFILPSASNWSSLLSYGVVHSDWCLGSSVALRLVGVGLRGCLSPHWLFSGLSSWVCRAFEWRMTSWPWIMFSSECQICLRGYLLVFFFAGVKWICRILHVEIQLVVYPNRWSYCDGRMTLSNILSLILN